MKTFRKLILSVAVVVALAPSHLLACASCGSANSEAGSSPLTDGMNIGILTLLGVLLTVLGSVAGFMVFLVRREAATQAQKSPRPNVEPASGELPVQNPSVA
ncbi:MAG TPA: hypothetical protein VFV23_01080 [Verrucomicrobiae bacterium]|nr:hypothetical protein [Verrucomicrobiae bacterium]